VADGGTGAVHQRLQAADLPYILGQRGDASAFGCGIWPDGSLRGGAQAGQNAHGEGSVAGSAPASMHAQLAALQEQNLKLAEFSTQMYGFVSNQEIHDF
jgi:hypothetical protein